LLKAIFADPGYCYHHDPLPACLPLGDEGAANHMRLARTHGEAGVEIFVYGEHNTQRYRARQTQAASSSVARLHQLPAEKLVMLQQNPAAIDAGVFHNDVIAVSNEHLLFCHEEAYARADALEEVQRKYGDELCVLPVSTHDLSLQEAVGTYLFNSQIITLPQGGMAMIAPKECEENPRTRYIIEAICRAENNPIRMVHYLDVRESMRNGGGPACLRLRVVMTGQERAAMHQGVMLTESLYGQLVAVVEQYYRDRLTLADLADVALLHEAMAAQEAVMRLLGLEVL
jgi:succinylarginine dihydrolase